MALLANARLGNQCESGLCPLPTGIYERIAWQAHVDSAVTVAPY